MKRGWIEALLGALALAAVAVSCKGGAQGSSEAEAAPAAKGTPVAATPSRAPATGQVVCQVNVTGGATATWTGHHQPADIHGAERETFATSDYWLTDDNLRNVLGALGSIDGKKTPEEKKRKLDEDMKKDPRFLILSFGCNSPETRLLFSASEKSKYKDIPMAPASYKIDNGFSKDTQKVPGTMLVMPITVGGTMYKATGGNFEIKKFDVKGLGGSFSFDAKEMAGDKTVHVAGTFDFPCSDHTGAPCSK